jgi:hypothetical protein
MSTHYICTPAIPFADLRAALPKIGLKEVETKDTSETTISVTDGSFFMFAYADDEGQDCSFERFGGNMVSDMLEAIAEHFDVEILSEHDEGYFEAMGFSEDEDEEDAES